MKYTKGTFKDGSQGWKAVPYENKVGFATHEIHWSDDGECVAEIVHGEEEAKLIAAAPDLLEALIEVVRISDRKHDAWDKAKAAILKATNNQ